MKKLACILIVFLIPFAVTAGNTFWGPGHDSTTTFYPVIKLGNVLDCEPEISLYNLETKSAYLYWAGNVITVFNNYRIPANANANITMKAGYTIVLKPHTAILRGNKYLARIEPCEKMPCPGAADAVVPKGISPNGDTYNETFDLSALCVTQLKIIDRYGMTVYEAQNYTNEWHGQSDKGNLPSATYYYVITLTSGEHLTGWVYVMQGE